MTDGPELDQDEPPSDPLARFRTWPGFLAAAVAVNLLFAYGMLASSGDPKLGLWYKALIWLPFNGIATVLYYAFKVKLADAAGGALYGILCLAMIAANWLMMFVA